MSKIVCFIQAREKDLGGFTVHRMLPYAHKQMVGPFIFFDHMGPAYFQAGSGIDVRPHPHINLATVTFLFEGKILHRDNLGSNQLIEPGAINWMIAGKGIVHSERTPKDLRSNNHTLSGIQCWLALPDEFENIDPSFTHYPAEQIPKLDISGIEVHLLLGSAFRAKSPVKVFSDLFYVYAKLKLHDKFIFPVDHRESAIYVINGKIRIEDEIIPQYTMVILNPCNTLLIESIEAAEIMLLGGQSIGKRFIYWNFVSSLMENIEQAKKEWMNGPGKNGSRFAKIPGDDAEFIPLPADSHEQNPKGTIM